MANLVIYTAAMLSIFSYIMLIILSVRTEDYKKDIKEIKAKLDLLLKERNEP